MPTSSGIGEAGEIWIVEIKSSPEDFRADLKWPEYRDYCDRLFFAIPTSMDPDMMPADAGLMVADSWGADILRQAEATSLHAARRKAVTLAFARAAALRLHGLYDPLADGPLTYLGARLARMRCRVRRCMLRRRAVSETLRLQSS